VQAKNFNFRKKNSKSNFLELFQEITRIFEQGFYSKEMQKALFFRISLSIIITFVIQCKQFNRNQEKKVDFSLNTIDSKFVLNKTDKIRLVYFGFLSCPDACPTTFQIISQSMKTLSEEERSKVEILFIDIDSKRDSLPQIKKYVDHFYPGIIPLSGSEDELHKVAEQFNAFFMEVPIESEMKYTMDHSTRVYVIDKDNYLIDSIPHNIPIEVFTQYIRKNLN
jgi:protein SCO1